MRRNQPLGQMRLQLGPAQLLQDADFIEQGEIKTAVVVHP